MDKSKLKDVYDSIKYQIEILGHGELIDFGAGGLQDSYKQVEVRRFINMNSYELTVYDPYKTKPDYHDICSDIKILTAIVYREIIDDVTEYGFNPEYLD